MTGQSLPEQSNSRTPLGRASFWVERFADDLHRSIGGPPLAKARRLRLNRQRVGRLLKQAGEGHFEVLLVDEDGYPTGFIAKVSVTYSRFDEAEANGRRS
jgi:hypothetical protein